MDGAESGTVVWDGQNDRGMRRIEGLREGTDRRMEGGDGQRNGGMGQIDEWRHGTDKQMEKGMKNEGSLLLSIKKSEYSQTGRAHCNPP